MQKGFLLSLFLLLSSFKSSATNFYFLDGAWSSGTWSPYSPGNTILAGDTVFVSNFSFFYIDTPLDIYGTLDLDFSILSYTDITIKNGGFLDLTTNGGLVFQSNTTFNINPLATIKNNGTINIDNANVVGNLDNPNGLITIGDGNTSLIGNYSSTNNSKFLVQHYAGNPPAVGDLNITGTATLNGQLRFSYFSSAPTLGDEYTIISASSVIGTFSNTYILLNNGTYANIYYYPTEVKLKIENSPLLPIELIRFEVIQKGTDNLFLWETAMEENVDYFEVERSLDGVSFEAINRVKAQNIPSKYDSKDNNDSKSFYYRLKIVDLDNSIYYSKIIYCRAKQSNKRDDFGFYPNLVQDVVNIKNTRTDFVSVRIFDFSGKLLLTQDVNSSLQTIDVSFLPKGTYILLLFAENEIVTEDKIVKI